MFKWASKRSDHLNIEHKSCIFCKKKKLSWRFLKKESKINADLKNEKEKEAFAIILVNLYKYIYLAFNPSLNEPFIKKNLHGEKTTSNRLQSIN